MEYHLCPHSLFLWEREPLRIEFGQCVVQFRSAAQTYILEGYEAATLQVARFIASGAPGIQGLRTRLQL